MGEWVKVGHRLWYYFDPSLFKEWTMITKEHIENWFTYHSPAPEQVPKYQAIREAGLKLAETIMNNTPASADQSDAIRSVRNAVMTANAAIACEGK
jgi:hypothetical protein